MFAGERNHQHRTQFLNSKLKDALPRDHIGGPNGALITQIPPNARFGRITPKPDAQAARACRAGAAYLT